MSKIKNKIIGFNILNVISVILVYLTLNILLVNILYDLWGSKLEIVIVILMVIFSILTAIKKKKTLYFLLYGITVILYLLENFVFIK